MPTKKKATTQASTKRATKAKASAERVSPQASKPTRGTKKAPREAAPQTPLPVLSLDQAVLGTETTTAQAAPATEQAPLTLHREAPSLTVGMLQKRLCELGFYRGLWDGQYGPLTREAVGHFQYRRGLYPNGHASAQTLAALGF